MRQRIKQGLAGMADGAGINRRKLRQTGCVILMMHKINDLVDPLPLTLSPEHFARMIEEIQRSNRIVPLEQATAASANGGGLKFVMTFDDGYRDNYEQALPIMKRYRVPAMVYISVDHVEGRRSFWYETLISAISGTAEQRLDLSALDLGSFDLEDQAAKVHAITELNQALKRYDTDTREHLVKQVAEMLGRADQASGSSMLTWDMVREMADQDVSIGSHTMSHPILSRESRERVRLELRDSKTRLETVLQRAVDAFAYPNGRSEDFNDMVVEEAKEAGYSSAVTTMPGINTAATDSFMLKRIEVHNRMCSDVRGRFSPALFWANVFGMFRGYWR